MEKPMHDPSLCVWKHGRWECLHAIDADHFWYGDVMVDLVALRYERDSLNARVADPKTWAGGGRDIHGRNTAIYMLEVYADWLLRGKLLEPEKPAKYLRMANQYGLHTGVKFQD